MGDMEEELCVRVVEVRWVSDRVLTVVCEEDMLRLICGYALWQVEEVWT